GSSNDIERATAIARSMVCEWGMSDKLGLLAFGRKNEQIFLGREISQHRDFSESTAQMIDEEITSIVNSCKNRAIDILESNNDKFEKISQYLIERETLNAEEIEMVMKGEELPPLSNGETIVTADNTDNGEEESSSRG
ncbi:MAG TPA: cell division protein FtsH, partial [Spirochaetota bacterium]|nr:cell division protein FtsH [Spirochaetota bacterium]